MGSCADGAVAEQAPQVKTMTVAFTGVLVFVDDPCGGSRPGPWRVLSLAGYSTHSLRTWGQSPAPLPVTPDTGVTWDSPLPSLQQRACHRRAICLTFGSKSQCPAKDQRFGSMHIDRHVFLGPLSFLTMEGIFHGAGARGGECRVSLESAVLLRRSESLRSNAKETM